MNDIINELMCVKIFNTRSAARWYIDNYGLDFDGWYIHVSGENYMLKQKRNGEWHFMTVAEYSEECA